MIRPLVVVAFSLAALAVACGGAVTGVGDGTSSSSGSSSGGSSGTSSSSSSSSSSGASSSGSSGESCTTATEAGDRVCVPGVAIADLPITVDVDGTSCIPCGSTLQGCTVDVSGQLITLTMSALVCSTEGQACPGVCGLPKETCTIPALAAGTYSVTVAGAPQDPSTGIFQERTLVVAPNGTGASCTLGDPNVQPTLDPTKYSTACMTDNDCVAVSTGNSVCSECAGGCPNTAIAVADQATYQADLRAASSQCEPEGAAACPACFLPQVTCVKTSAGPGSCQILTD